MVQEVSIQELDQAIASGARVIDVRELDEFDAGHVPSAIHIPLNSIPERLGEIPTSQRLWLICKSGGRSMTAANYLEAQGFDVVSVAGGTMGWIAAGKPVSFEASK